MNGANSDIADFNPEDGYSEHDLENFQFFKGGLMNCDNSDDAVSIQKMVTPNMVGGTWILLNMVTTKLFGTLLHRYGCVQLW